MRESHIPEHLLNSLKERQSKGALRTLKKRFPPIDFCSNDYLGFSKLGLLTAKYQGADNSSFATMGSTGSRLISGNSDLIEETEKQIALFHHGSSALIFNSGYDANIGLFSSVPKKNDLVLFDEHIHASIYDGIRLSHAAHYKFRHNNLQSLQELVHRHKANYTNIFIAVESVYSMNGDTAPLVEMVDLYKHEKNIFLIVDEAHAVGVFGKQGRGLCNALNIEKHCFARVYTYGKAMGCHGATVVGSETLRKYLLNFARSFIYTTALPNHSVKSIIGAYQLLIELKQQDLLQENIAYFYSKAKKISGVIESQSAIQSFVVGNNHRADELEALLEKNQIHAKAIKSPTVAEGFERVRICLHAFNTKEEIDLLLSILMSF
jgi:8-amino-7-oxononanoate synthase